MPHEDFHSSYEHARLDGAVNAPAQENLSGRSYDRSFGTLRFDDPTHTIPMHTVNNNKKSLWPFGSVSRQRILIGGSPERGWGTLPSGPAES